MKNIEEAKKARLKAYVPYSHFKVGAANELKDGTFIHGANIEMLHLVYQIVLNAVHYFR
jgi:cytidine deaminase